MVGYKRRMEWALRCDFSGWQPKHINSANSKGLEEQLVGKASWLFGQNGIIKFYYYLYFFLDLLTHLQNKWHTTVLVIEQLPTTSGSSLHGSRNTQNAFYTGQKPNPKSPE